MAVVVVVAAVVVVVDVVVPGGSPVDKEAECIEMRPKKG